MDLGAVKSSSSAAVASRLGFARAIVWSALSPLLILGLFSCSRSTLSLQTQTKTVGLVIQNFCPDPGYAYSQVFANNQSAVLSTTGWLSSTNRDFLSDDFKADPATKATFGFSTTVADSIQAGYRDGVVYKLGYTIASGQNIPACANPYVDTDGDGLWDCEELLIATSATNPDTDADGIPDGIEFRMGLSPVNASDAQLETSEPGVTNLLAAVYHLLVNVTPNDFQISLKYKYEVTSLSGGCYSFRITNIPIMLVDNGNMLEVLVLENATNGTPKVNFVRALVPKETIDRKVIILPGVTNQVYDPDTNPYTFE